MDASGRLCKTRVYPKVGSLGVTEVWKPSAALIDALHPSTSKDHVLPRLEHSVFVQRKEVLSNLIALERTQSISQDYFERVQTEITPPMRSILLEWMLEVRRAVWKMLIDSWLEDEEVYLRAHLAVCEEERCSCEVFPLAASYVDRFLSVEAVQKCQLQALGTACLFVASKVKLINPFTAPRLVDYTDEGVSVSEVLSWEMLLLDRLNWDVSTLTALDFLDQYLHRLKLPNRLMAGLRPYLNYLVALAVIDFPIAALPPSMVAASCLQVAATHVSRDMDAGRQMMEALRTLTDLNTEAVEIHASRIHELSVQKQNGASKAFLTSSTESWYSAESKHLSCETANDQESSSGVNGAATLTPTEIEDVVIF